MRTSRSAAVVRIGLVVAVCLSTVHWQAVEAQAEEGLVWDGVVSETPARPLFVDHVHRRLYATSDDYNVLAEYDLDRPPGAMLVRKRTLPLEGSGLHDQHVALDVAGRRAFIADRGVGYGDGCICSFIRILDLHSLDFTETWNVHEIIPNFYVHGIAYSEGDPHLYLAGTVIGDTAARATDDAREPYYPVAVVAIDVQTGHLAWFRHLNKCFRPMTHTASGGHIFRSHRLPALYIGCARPDAPKDVAMYPGTSGVLRLWIDPTADQQAALGFREEFFRSPGSYFATVGPIARAAFDYQSERFVFVTSSRGTPGAWVLDGIVSSWVGFVPTGNPHNAGIGIDSATGHLFVRNGSEDGARGVIVTDVRATPLPQGRVYHLSSDRGVVEPQYGLLYAVDPVTRRVFMSVYPQGNPTSGAMKLMAFRDETPVAPPETPPAYDDLTTDLPEGPETIISFAGSARGFGARAFLVGGLGGATAPAKPGLVGNTYDRQVGDVVPPADRGLWAARVSSIDLRNVGASAEAQSVAMDEGTNDQRRSAQRDIANAGVPGSATSTLEWPWPAAFCLDAGQDPAVAHPPSLSGRAEAACDLKAETATASAQAGAFSLEGVSVASTRFTGSSTRRAGSGIAVDSVATAHGVEVEVKGVGSLRIDDVRQEVTTQAAGRPGTARVTWKPSIEGVHLLDASGKTVLACAERCDLGEVASRVNEVFDPLMRMRVPTPERVQTPRGAFAGFREDGADFANDLVINNDAWAAAPAVQLEIFNDWSDKSRLVLQLAAVESSAVYGISSIGASTDTGEDPGPAGQSPTPLPPAGVIEAPSYPGAQLPALPPASVALPPSSVLQRVARAALFAVRSPRDAVSMALILMLFGGVVTLGARRGSLVRLLSRRQAG